MAKGTLRRKKVNTGITLDQEVFSDLKALARESQQTVSGILEALARREIRRSQRKKEKVES